MSNNSRLNDGATIGLHANTLITFVDGRKVTIRDIVNNRIRGQVWAYDEINQRFVESDILDWAYLEYMGTEDEYVYVETFGPDCSRGRFGFAATQNCKVLTHNGWRETKELTIGDRLLTKYDSKINETVANFLWGTMIGDCVVKKKEENRYNLIFTDNINPNYVNWKVGKVGVAFDFKSCLRTRGSDDREYYSNYCFELKMIKEILGQRDPCAMLRNHYSDLGLAVWYMDDGTLSNGKKKRASISVKRFKNNKEKLDEIAALLSANGVPCSCVVYGYGDIVFKGPKLCNLLNRICKYVPDCMQYKLLEEFRNKYEEFALSYSIQQKEAYVPVLLMRPASDRQLKYPGKYLISTQCGNCMVGSRENGIIIQCGLPTIKADTKHDHCIGKNSVIDLHVERGGVSSDTYISYAINNNDGNKVNHKGGTVLNLYNRFHDVLQCGRANQLARSEAVFSAPTINNGGYVAHQEIADVVRLPVGRCYKISTVTGQTIVVSAAQCFYVSDNTYIAAKDLTVGDYIYIHNRTRFTKESVPRHCYKEVLVKYHPHGIKKIVEGKYQYYRVLVSHAVYEASANGMPYDNYIGLLNSGSKETIDKLWFVDKVKYDIHHKDLNPENNSLENLELLTKEEHGKLHALQRQQHLSFVAVEDQVCKIEVVEDLELYSIVCKQGENYIANGFVLANAEISSNRQL